MVKSSRARIEISYELGEPKGIALARLYLRASVSADDARERPGVHVHADVMKEVPGGLEYVLLQLTPHEVDQNRYEPVAHGPGEVLRLNRALVAQQD